MKPAPTHPVALSQTQTGIYISTIQSDQPTIYHLPHLNFMPGVDDAQRLAEAVRRLVEAYPVLSASISLDAEGVPVMTARPDRPVAVETAEMTEEQLHASYDDLTRPFDFEKGPLSRLMVIKTEKGVYLFTDIHHTVYDGLSRKAFMEQLDRAYRGLPLEEEELSAFDIAAREAEERLTPELDRQHGVYASLLEGCHPTCEIMPDAAGAEEAFATMAVTLPVKSEDYKRWCADHSLPQSIPATTAAGIALTRFYRRDDVTFATVFNGRNKSHRNTISMMVRTLPVRVSLTPGETVGRLMQGLMKQQKAFRDNGLYSFADAARDFGVNSDFIFAYQGELLDLPEVNGKKVEVTELPMVSTGENISVEMMLEEAGATLHISYRSDLYSESLIRALADAISEILEQIMAKGLSAPVDSLDTMSEEDCVKMLEISCGGPSLADPEATVPALVTASAHKYPDKTAIVFGDRRLTYEELDRTSDALAHYLRDKVGVKPGDFVGIMIDRSELMAVYPLAVMKAGAAYMPLDPHFPEERLEFMVGDAGLKTILDEDNLVAQRLPSFKGAVVHSDVLSTLDRNPEPICLCGPDSPMVVLYTSGSTGKPKGVVLRQRNVVNFCATYINLISLGVEDRTGAYATFGFDAHIMDLYPALQAGATVHIFDPEVRLDLTAMHDYIDREKITVLFMTTQIAWQMATLFDLPSVRVFSGGGEKLPPLGPLPYRFLNLYGPTECSVIATAYELQGATEGRVIGRAIPGYEVRILDPRLQPVPVGVPGELVILGGGVAGGYLNRDDLTAAKFLTIDGRPAYRTGDLGRYLADGQIEFLGRMDGMVKLRGLRIELGEIEAVASRHPAVKSFVAAVKEIGGMENLAGYYVVKEGQTLEPDELRAFMAEELTEFMIPSVIIPLESMPLTPNGKVDRKALPVPEVAPTEIVAPSTDMESRVLAIAAEVLSHDTFGVNSNLVAEGLTSLMAMRLTASIMKETGLKITAKEIMSAPTVAEIAGKLESCSPEESTPQAAARPRRRFYPLTENQRGVYIDWEMNRDALQYNIPQAFRLPDGTDVDRLRKALEEVVEAHPGLKTRMVMRGADVMQQRDDDAVIEIKVTELDRRPDSAFFQERVRPFNLLEDPLIRCEIFTFGDEVYLMRDTHHIIFDGVSAMVFNSDLIRAFGGEPVEKETYGALDHALDEADLLESEAAEKAEEWFASLVGESEPTQYPRSAEPDNDIAGGMGRLTLRMPADTVRDFCRRGALTVSNYFLSSMLQLLHRLTREKTVQITTVNNGRADMRLLPTTGMYVKTLPVVSRCEKPDASPLDFAKEVRKQFLTTQDYDFYPFTSLVEKYGVRPEIMYVFEGGIDLGGDVKSALSLEPIELSLDTAKVPLTLLVFEPDKSEYELVVEYDTSIYSRRDMELLLQMMRTLSESLAEAATVADGVMADSVQEEALNKIRDGRTGSVPYRSFPGAMESWAAVTPDAPAVIACDKAMTYREFDEECNRVANFLMSKGVQPGDRVVVLLPRRSYLISSIYGIMKTGAAYIPCDPEYPADRIRLITEDSGARFIITTPDRMELYPGKALDVNEVVACDDTKRPDVEIDPDSIAYMIYTSGSTGRPKGVMIPHRCITNYLFGYYTEFYREHPEIKVNMLIVTISFDASLVDLGTSLTSGHALVLANEEECKDVTLLSQLMLRYNVDAFDITPSRLDAMLELPDFAKAVSQAKLLNIGGEGFKTSLINKLFATGFDGLAVNEYGPTECTVGSNHNLLYPDRPITAGPAFYNESERIIDAWGGELPVGAVGELYIFGAGVGAGYNNLPEKTAEAFVDWHGLRGYRTGDLARWDETGDVTILGRIDHQVKLRGLRIELGEIENVALSFPGIKMAAADVREVNNIQHLCLYFTAEGVIDTDKLQKHLAASLTDYMVPDAYTQVEAMPLTPNGKINRKALPAPKIADEEPYEEPAEGLEKTIADAFARILNRERVGANDNFFSIGGTSINAIKVVAALAGAGHTVSYKNVFEARTPRRIAALIEGRSVDAASESKAAAEKASAASKSEFAEVLDANNLRTFLDGESQSIGNVLLTGATGFMGIHMLHELLTTTDSRVYCTLRRKGDVSAESRLRTMLFYYFDNTFDEEFAAGRVNVIEADVTDPVPASLEGGKIDTVINCAANVKHFSAGDDIEKVNVESVRNLVDFCLREGARIVHVSTVSVAGESVDGTPDPETVLTENMLDFGQNLSNQYVHSKYNAEHLLLTAVRDKGLNAKIMRVGNLSARGSDGEFQINFRSNAFMGRIKAYVAIGCVPFEALDAPCEFSPIDEVCRAILMLAGTAKDLTVLQPCNNHRLPLGDVLHIVDRLGYSVIPVEDEEYRRRLTEAMEDPSKVSALQPLLAYDSDSLTTTYIGYDSSFTNQLLYRLGFRWNYTSREYVVQFLKAIAGLNYFSL